MVIPRKIGRYRIKQELAKSQFSEVYRGYDNSTNQKVVIKLLRNQDNTELCARLQQEANVLKKLKSAPIVPLHDFIKYNERSCLVTRYMPGGTLTDRIANGTLPLKDIISIVDRVATALDHAHKNKIVHRDLKPNNILFDENERAFLADFGLAKRLDALKPITQSASYIGTPLYMSPEQIINPQHVDSSTDIFSLGVIFYEMLTGKHPYKHENVYEIWTNILKKSPPRLTNTELKELGLPRKCNQILRKAMARNPADRYVTASGMASDIALLNNSAAWAEFKDFPIDTSIIKRLRYTLAKMADNQIYGGVANNKQFNRMYVLFDILIGIIVFIAAAHLEEFVPKKPLIPITQSTATTSSVAPQSSTPTSTSSVTPTLTNSIAPTQNSTPTPRPIATPTWTPFPTPKPTNTVHFTPTPSPQPTNTPTPSKMPESTNASVPPETDTPEPTNTLVPPETDTPEPTNTLVPPETDTPEPTNTLVPPETDTPEPTNTLVPP